MQASIRRYETVLSTRSTNSERSDDSRDSQSTAHTSLYSASPRPSLLTAQTEPLHSKPYNISPATTYYPRSSTETYQSAASLEELFEEPETYDPEYDLPEYDVKEEYESNVRPSTPSDFAEYFPSSRRLHICHDDTAYDGNMNLRVETEDSKLKEVVQLFHLRLHDLKKREFSLRRYERSSGREVCHTSRQISKPVVEKRPGLTRSMSSAFASIRKPDLKRSNTGVSAHSTKSVKSLKRQDSGYGSSTDGFDDEVESFMGEKKDSSLQLPTNTTKIEFSNYARVEVKRRGAKSSKRYEFEYWGHAYTWKRVTEKDGSGKAVSYHLFKGDASQAVAHIVPEMRSPRQMYADEAAGGWVPPCSMWISDKSVLEALTDVAE